jgi:hypothetical protein
MALKASLMGRKRGMVESLHFSGAGDTANSNAPQRFAAIRCSMRDGSGASPHS